MPATRSSSRQASRQPSPLYAHRPQNAPSDPAPQLIALSDDEDGPTRKRQAMERKPSRQRSKQKARAPLPPPSEVIEISSDEDEPPAKRKRLASEADRRLKALEEENKRLKEQLAVATAAAATAKGVPSLAKPPSQPHLSAETPSPDAKLLAALEDHVTCEVCTVKMWPPYTLACGHTFCQGCIQDWFSTCLVKHLEVYPNYDAQRLLRPELRAFLARPDLPPHARRKAECESIMMLLGTPQPEYSCPTCRVVIRTKPAENFVVKHVVRTIAGVQGEPYPTAAPAPRMPGMPTEGPFDAFFPPDLRLALNP